MALSVDKQEVQPCVEWYRQAVLYQVYPLSFQDSNDDGKGDLPGLLMRLDHLDWLGVDALWLGPIYCSPMLDWGFDVSNFTSVDPAFGTLKDLDRLVRALHQRGTRLILDIIPNHTSDQHPWFQESRSSRNSARRDWYVWADPAPDGGPPNNWNSRFGGSAWEFDPNSGQYYYHAFLKEQPDLNWRNPQVRAAFAEVLRFWLQRGVDGFRLDASAVLVEDRKLRDDPPDPHADERQIPPERQERKYTNYRPEVLDMLAELRKVVDEFPGRILLGEVDTAADRIKDFYGSPDRPILQAPLNYLLVDTDWEAGNLTRGINDYLDKLPDGAVPVWAIGSHDKQRVATRVGRDQARLAAMLALALDGMAIFYAGDEIGMEDVSMQGREALDPFERRVPGYGMSRDPERSPLPWNGEPNGGFSKGTPWLPLRPDYAQCNVARERADRRSILSLYRQLIALRHAEPALAYGSLARIDADGPVLFFTRACRERRLLVALNLSDAPRSLPFSAGKIVLSTGLDREGESVKDRLALRAAEGVIVAIEDMKG